MTLSNFVISTLAAGTFAVLAATGFTGLEVAQADMCVQQCRDAYNQCRMAQKGSPSCDGQLQACLGSCRARR